MYLKARQHIFNLFFFSVSDYWCFDACFLQKKNGLFLPNHMQNPRNIETRTCFHDGFSVSLYSYFPLSPTISHCILARDCPNTGFTMKGAKRNGEYISEPDIMAFPREWEQEKPKTLCYSLLFLAAIFLGLSFSWKAIFSTKAVQERHCISLDIPVWISPVPQLFGCFETNLCLNQFFCSHLFSPAS